MQETQLASAEKVAKQNAAAAAARPTATGSTPAKKAAPAKATAAKAPAKKASPAATTKAEQKTSTSQGRVRDQNRSATTSPDKAGSPNSRNPKGAGTKTKQN